MPNTRVTDPSTSFEAAASITPESLSATKKWILKFLNDRPRTDESLILAFRRLADVRVSESGIRSRRAELVELGLVKDSGLRQKLTSGRNAIVWESNFVLWEI